MAAHAEGQRLVDEAACVDVVAVGNRVSGCAPRGVLFGMASSAPVRGYEVLIYRRNSAGEA